MEIKEYQRAVIKLVYIYASFTTIAMLFVNKGYSISFLLGTLFSLLVFNMRVKQLVDAYKVAKGRSFANAIIRYLIYGFGLFIAFKFDKVELFPFLIGLLTCNLMMISKEIIDYRTKKTTD